MSTFSDAPSPYTQPSPLLLGIVVDVSSSMRRNWCNKDGKKLPRIAVIRDTLNELIKKEQRHQQFQDGNAVDIEIFCLGMGFKAITHWKDVDVSYEREHSLGNAAREGRVVDLVCDLLALGEILPSKDELQDFKVKLNQKWLHCSKDLLDRSIITENVYADLVEYLQIALYSSAMKNLQQSLLYRFVHSHWSQRFHNLSSNLQKVMKDQEEKIALTSQIASAEFADSVFHKTSNDFKAHTDKYIALIRHHLQEFARSYTASTLQALTLGFEIAELVDDLDEKRVTMLAKQIQTDLEAEVKKHIALALEFHKHLLLRSGRHISASLDMKEVRSRTERFIRKLGWDILRPLLEETVSLIFAEQFEAQARESFPYWVQLASVREIIRPLNQLSNLLPTTLEGHFYSDEIMFGSTPFVQALDRAAVRLIDKTYKDRKKVLVIISDGEFEQIPHVMISVNSLKKRGVTIISCLVAERNMLAKCVNWSLGPQSQGAKLMVEIASSASSQEHAGISWKEKNNVYPVTDEKLCFQINHASILEDVLETVFDCQGEMEEE